MSALYITSVERGSGKTALAAGLAKILVAKGKKVGYIKPVTASIDADAAFMKQLVSPSETLEAISPIIRNSEIKKYYDRIAQGKDVVIIEGTPPSGDIINAVNAKAIVVEAYSKEPFSAIESYKALGQGLLGVVLNKVPKTKRESFTQEGRDKLGKAGINILGVLPEDRTMMALSIGELAANIKGEFLSGTSQSDELVENLMLGALGLDPGTVYFGRKDNKAVVLRVERPDMQLAALETSTRCLVLAGSKQPNSMVISEAALKNVPIILAKNSTVPGLAENIEAAIAGSRFSQAGKIPHLTQLIEQNLDLPKIYTGLGV